MKQNCVLVQQIERKKPDMCNSFALLFWYWLVGNRSITYPSLNYVPYALAFTDEVSTYQFSHSVDAVCHARPNAQNYA